MGHLWLDNFQAHQILIFSHFSASSYSWFLRKPTQTLEEVPIPPLRGDELHNMTVLPYLMDYHYVEDPGSGQPQYYTEHERNGKCHITAFKSLIKIPVDIFFLLTHVNILAWAERGEQDIYPSEWAEQLGDLKSKESSPKKYQGEPIITLWS